MGGRGSASSSSKYAGLTANQLWKTEDDISKQIEYHETSAIHARNDKNFNYHLDQAETSRKDYADVQREFKRRGQSSGTWSYGGIDKELTDLYVKAHAAINQNDANSAATVGRQLENAEKAVDKEIANKKRYGSLSSLNQLKSDIADLRQDLKQKFG